VIDLTTTNALLGILAAVAVLQTTGLIVGAVMVSRAWRRGLERLDQIERGLEEKLAPAAARAQVVFDRLDRVTERVDAGAEKLDHALAVTARGAGVAMAAVNGNVRRTAMLAAAVASGGRAALRAWRAGAARQPRREPVFLPSSVTAARVPSGPVNHNTHSRTEEHHVSIRG
jgi:hypothetical protein